MTGWGRNDRTSTTCTRALAFERAGTVRLAGASTGKRKKGFMWIPGKRVQCDRPELGDHGPSGTAVPPTSARTAVVDIECKCWDALLVGYQATKQSKALGFDLGVLLF